MSSSQDRRPNAARPPRRRREPLFQLEDDDIGPRERRGPPQPLGDLFSDIDEAMGVTPAAGRPSRTPSPEPEVVRRERPAPQNPPRAQTPPDSRATYAPRPTVPPIDRTPRPTVPPIDRTPRRPPRYDGMLDDLHSAGVRVREAERVLHQIQSVGSASYGGYRRAGPPFIALSPLTLLVIAIGSMMVLLFFGVGGAGGGMSRWVPPIFGSAPAELGVEQLSAVAHQAGDYTLRGAPTISAAQIDRILASYGSPATGTGEAWHALGLKYGIDPAFAIAFFIHESSAGTNQAWAGLKPDGSSTHNVGNIICAGYDTCYNRFRDYPSWEAGIDDWYRLIDVEYIRGRGTLTVADIIPIYAPAFENDVQAYVRTVENMVDGWRTNGVP